MSKTLDCVAERGRFELRGPFLNDDYVLAPSPAQVVVAMRRVDHQLQRRVDDRAGLLRVEVLHQLGRALDIREQRRDRLALALGRRQIRRDLADANRRISFYLRCRRYKRCGALSAEFEARRILEATLGTDQRQRVGWHCPQNFMPSGFSNPHLPQRILGSQLVEQRLGVFQISGVEALGEPAVDFGEHRKSLVSFALLREQPGEIRRRA